MKESDCTLQEHFLSSRVSPVGFFQDRLFAPGIVRQCSRQSSLVRIGWNTLIMAYIHVYLSSRRLNKNFRKVFKIPATLACSLGWSANRWRLRRPRHSLGSSRIAAACSSDTAAAKCEKQSILGKIRKRRLRGSGNANVFYEAVVSCSSL